MCVELLNLFQWRWCGSNPNVKPAETNLPSNSNWISSQRLIDEFNRFDFCLINFYFFLLRSFNWISSGFLFLFLGRWWGRAQEAPVDGTGHHQRNISRSFSQTARRERFRPSQHMWVLFIHIHMKKKTNLSLHWLFHYFGSPFIYLFIFFL